MSKRKTHDEFVEEIGRINDKFDVISEYKNAKTKVKCKCKIDGYIWNALPSNLLKGQGCPKCSKSLRRSNEEFHKEVGTLYPFIDVTGTYENVRSKMTCKCKIDGNEWSTTAAGLLYGKGCMECYRRSLRKTHTKFAKELEIINDDIELLEKYVNTETKIKCKCKIDGYVWEAWPGVLLRGSGCPICSGKKKKTDEEFVEQLRLKHPFIEPIDHYVNTTTPMKFRCEVCNHEWTIKPMNILKNRGCPRCNKRFKTSFPEQAIYYYVKKVFPDAVSGYKDIFDNGMELDIYIPSIQLGIEYDGEVWHGEAAHEKEVTKYGYCQKHGIKLLRIRERILENNRYSADELLSTEDLRDRDNLENLIRFLLDKISPETNFWTKTDMRNNHSNVSVNLERDEYEIREYMTSLKDKSLADVFPEVAAQWNYEKKW